MGDGWLSFSVWILTVPQLLGLELGALICTTHLTREQWWPRREPRGTWAIREVSCQSASTMWCFIHEFIERFQSFVCVFRWVTICCQDIMLKVLGWHRGTFPSSRDVGEHPSRLQTSAWEHSAFSCRTVDAAVFVHVPSCFLMCI